MGRRAHLRLAAAVPPAGPRLRTQARSPRGHGVLGHHHDYDKAPGQIRNRNSPGQTVGRRPQPSLTETRSTGRMTTFIYRLLGGSRCQSVDRLARCCRVAAARGGHGAVPAGFASGPPRRDDAPAEDPGPAAALPGWGASAHSLALPTFCRNGDPVTTPVWFAADGDRLLVWTEAGSGKVKRLRANPAVTIAPCSVSGTLR